ncbi:MAG TPA: hypothetical protein VG984_02065 [Candidatus Paceibacterota bacterium]|nr:hypothetical protein [Candidatus Paceibacterota bacterium]
MNTLLSAGDTFKDVISRLIGLMNLLIWPLIGFAILFFFYALVRFVFKGGDSKARIQGRQAILWSLIALFVLFSLWGLVRLLQTAVFVGTPAQELQRGTQPL